MEIKLSYLLSFTEMIVQLLRIVPLEYESRH